MINSTTLKLRPYGSAGKEPACNARDREGVGLIPESGKSSGGGDGSPLVVFMPEKHYGLRSLEGYSPLDRRVQHNLATKQQQSSDNVFKSKKPTIEEYPQNTNNSYTSIRKKNISNLMKNRARDKHITKEESKWLMNMWKGVVPDLQSERCK